jgi:hypothetical protein
MPPVIVNVPAGMLITELAGADAMAALTDVVVTVPLLTVLQAEVTQAVVDRRSGMAPISSARWIDDSRPVLGVGQRAA